MAKIMLPTLIERSVTDALLQETHNPRLPFVGEDDLVHSSDPQIRTVKVIFN